MFRKMLATTAALGLMALVAVTNAEAGDFGVRVGVGSGYYGAGYHGGYYRYPGHGRYERESCYHVYYRHCDGHRWRLYDTYHSHSRAHRTEHWLERQGYEARVVHR